MAVSAASQTPERTPISFRAWLGIVLLFLFFAIFVLVLVAATPHGNNYEAKRARAREEKLKTTRDAATKELSAYAWVDKAKGVARIPIDRAMQLTVRDLASKKPAAANPIEAPAPTAAGASATPKPTSVQGATSENRGQPAAASNPPGAIPGTQPGLGATPAASPPPSGQPAISPSATPEQKPPPGTPPPEKTPA